MTSLSPHAFIRTEDVLAGKLSSAQATALEQQYGHGKLMQLLKAVGVGGPFKVDSPWELTDPQGSRIINASGYAALPFGDNPPELNAFIREVLEKTDQVMFAQQSITTWRAALEANLVRLLARESGDHHDSRVFFSNSGAEAIEAAIKFAQAARPQAKYLINFTRAYHGKTLGSLSVTPNPNLQGPFRNILNPAVITLPYGDIEAVRAGPQAGGRSGHRGHSGADSGGGGGQDSAAGVSQAPGPGLRRAGRAGHCRRNSNRAGPRRALV